MENLKIAAVALLGVFLITACDPKMTVPDTQIYNTSGGTHLLGPESFPYCGGWVAVWAEFQPRHDPRLFVKFSPPKGHPWHIWNSHIVVAGLRSKESPLRFVAFKDFDTRVEKGDVASWVLEEGSQVLSDGLNVAFRPFDGCDQKQQARGVVLRPEMPVTTP